MHTDLSDTSARQCRLRQRFGRRKGKNGPVDIVCGDTVIAGVEALRRNAAAKKPPGEQAVAAEVFRRRGAATI
jgi:hypothetical protein